MFDVAIVGAGPSRARASSCSTDRTRSKQMEGHLATAQKYLPLGFVLAFALSAGHQTVLRAGSDAKEFAFTTADASGTSTLAQGINDAGDISGIFAAHRRAPSMPEAGSWAST